MNYQQLVSTLTGGGRWAVLAAGLLTLSACGGGGGGGGTLPTVSPSIEIDSSKTISTEGLGKQVSYTWDDSKFSSIGSTLDAQTKAVLEFDKSDILAALTIETTTATSSPVTTKMSFLGYDQIKSLGADFWIARNDASKAIVSNPMSAAWDYQTFGVWESGLDASGGYYGAMSVGDASPVSAIASAYGATFTGKVIGSYVSEGIGKATLADLTVLFDTGGQTLTFTATGTRYAENGDVIDLPKLDMRDQTLTYKPGTSGFSGDLNTTGGLSGNSTGQFYGPNATELGGVFFLRSASGPPVETYSGAYGAKRPAP